MSEQAPTGDDPRRPPTDEELRRLQRTTVLYYLHETNPDNGLVRDKTQPGRPVQHRRRRPGPGDHPGDRRARRRHPQVRGEDRPPPAPQPPRPPAGPGAGRRRVQGLLLPLPRHRHRPPGLAVRAVHPRLGVPVRRRAHLRRLLRPATRPTRPRSAGWPTSSTAGPTGTGRGTAARRSPTAGSPRPASCRTATTGYDEGLLLYLLGAGLADAPAAAGELRRLLRHLPVEGDLRPRAALLRAAVHPPALAPLDRLPRPAGRLHARARQRLLREQPAGDLRAAGVRRPQPAAVRRATGSTAGGSRPATAPAG